MQPFAAGLDALDLTAEQCGRAVDATSARLAVPVCDRPPPREGRSGIAPRSRPAAERGAPSCCRSRGNQPPPALPLGRSLDPRQLGALPRAIVRRTWDGPKACSRTPRGKQRQPSGDGWRSASGAAPRLRVVRIAFDGRSLDRGAPGMPGNMDPGAPSPLTGSSVEGLGRQTEPPAATGGDHHSSLAGVSQRERHHSRKPSRRPGSNSGPSAHWASTRGS